MHSSYVINVASLNNRLRMPSRKAVADQAAAAAEIGAVGLVVHGGHVRDGEDPAAGIANWRKLFERQQDKGGFRYRSWWRTPRAAISRWPAIWTRSRACGDAIGEFDAGFCLDTCHAWAGGEELLGIVERVKAITGRIDLVHLNNSRDEFDSARDRHANLTTGLIDPAMLTAVVSAAGAPVVLETPADGIADDLAYLRDALAGD